MTEIAIDLIRTDGGTQPRAELDLSHVEELIEVLREGRTFKDPVTVFYDGLQYWLADGFHRYHATKQYGLRTIEADVRQGIQDDAIAFSCGANATHGLRRTKGDIKRAIIRLITLPAWKDRKQKEIAKQCGASESFVSEILKDLRSEEFAVNPPVEPDGASLECVTLRTPNEVVSQFFVDFPQLQALSDSDNRTYTTKYGSVTTMNTTNIGQQQNLTKEQFLDEVFPGFHLEPRIVRPLNSLDDIFPGITEYQEQGAPVPESWKLPQEMRGAPAKSATLSALQSSESNEWYTPAQYVEVARELMGGIDLDPASNDIANQVVQATLYYDIGMNGLKKEWRGRIWLNPPYGFTDGKSNQEVWTNRLIEQYKAGITTEAMLLVNANTEAKWFQPLYGYLLCFTNHRIRFYNAEGASSQPTQGNALIYFGKQEARFTELFKQFGPIVRRIA